MELVDKHRKRMRFYAGFFLVIGLIQILAGTVGYFSADYLTLAEEVVYWVSGAFFVAGATMVWNGSRAGAIAILLWIVLIIALEVLGGDVSVVSVVRELIYVFMAFRMSLFAFRYWAAANEAGEGAIRGAAWLRWGGLFVVAPLAVIGAAGLGYMIISQPVSAEILSGSDIPGHQLAWMRENSMLHANETPLLFYSHGISSIAEDGNILTDKFVGSWWTDDDGDVQSAWARLGTICSVELNEAGGGFGVTSYKVQDVDQSAPVEIWLPDGDALHNTFIERMDYLNARHSTPEFKSACKEERPVDWDEVSRQNGLPVEVLDGADFPPAIENWLRGKDFLMTNEKPLWLYTRARYDLDESGLLMTDFYFGGWEQTEGVVDALWFEHGELCTIEYLEDESDDVLDWYKVAGPGEERSYKFGMPASGDVAEARIGELRELTEKYRTEAHAAACESGIDPEVEDGGESEPTTEQDSNPEERDI